MSDPVSEFLAREHDVLADIEVDQDSMLSADNASVMNGINNHLNNSFVGGILCADLAEFDDRRTNQSPPTDRASFTPSPNAINTMPKIEPEKIRNWREEQKLMLEKKDAEETKKKEAMREAAAKELSDWYAQREERLVKAKILNRKSEEEFIADRDGAVRDGAEWDRIAKLCEFSSKNAKTTSDLSRLRSLLLQLKSQKD